MKLYRYDARVYSTCSISVSGHETYGRTPVTLELYEYVVKKETRCGWWIDYPFKGKWVARGGGKRFAYPTKELALASLKRRKAIWLQILRRRIADAEAAIALVEREEKRLQSRAS